MRSRLKGRSDSLMSRLVGYFLLLSLFTVGLVGFTVYWQAAESLKESIVNRLQTAIVLKEDNLTLWTGEQRRNLAFIAWLPEVQIQAGRLTSAPPGDPVHQEAYSVLARYLSYVVVSLSDAEELFILDLAGNVILSTYKPHEGAARADAPFFLDGRSNTTLPPFYIEPETTRLKLTAATPIFNADKRRVAVLAAHLNLARIERATREYSGLGESGETYLVTADHRFVSAPRLLEPGRFPDAARSPGIDAALAGQSGSALYSNYQDVPVIGVYAWLPDLQAALLAEMSQDEAFAPARRLAWIVTGIGLLSAILLTAGVYLLSRQIARPILAIAETAKKVTAGDLAQVAPVMTADEVGVLAQAFNQMTARLRLLYEGLEQRVAERTVALTVANQRLQQEIAERCKAEETLRLQNEYLAALHEISLKIISRLNLPELLQDLVMRAGQLLHTPHGFVYLVTPGGQEMECRVGIGVFARPFSVRRQSGEGLTGRAWQSGRTLAIDNYSRWSGRIEQPELDQLGAAVGVPLISGHQVVGVIGLARGLGAQDERPFSEDELAFLNRFAQLAAIALDNVWLYTRAAEARAEAEAANRAKSAFLATMSHELRTPLNAIIGFTRLVRRKGAESLPARQLENLDRVLVSAEHLLKLINTILDIAKIEAGGLEVRPQSFAVPDLVADCVTTAQPLLRPAVTLAQTIASGIPAVYSDPDKVRQILLNLLSNAAKFTHQGEITVHCHQEADRLRLVVQDTGIGIPADALAHIFEAFYQADASTTRQYSGTGLGLSISRKLARMLGGELTVASQEGVGSVFTLEIPLDYRGPFVVTKPPA